MHIGYGHFYLAPCALILAQKNKNLWRGTWVAGLPR